MMNFQVCYQAIKDRANHYSLQLEYKLIQKRNELHVLRADQQETGADKTLWM